MPTQCIYVFYMDLRTNSDYFATQQQPFCVCKETGSSLYGRNFFFFFFFFFYIKTDHFFTRPLPIPVFLFDISGLHDGPKHK